MSRTVYYESEGEEKKIIKVQETEDNGMFMRITHKPIFTNDEKVTNIRKDKIIRYDE